MIADQTTRDNICEEWAAVRKLCAGSHRQAIIGGAGGAVFVNETPLESFYNLPLVLAFAVLDEVLDALIAQGIFSCRSWMLGAKMTASKGAVPWQNYALVEQGKTARNELAHQAKLLDKAQCLGFVDAIEVELRAWAVI
jgi:hypothetical protein